MEIVKIIFRNKSLCLFALTFLTVAQYSFGSTHDVDSVRSQFYQSKNESQRMDRLLLLLSHSKSLSLDSIVHYLQLADSIPNTNEMSRLWITFYHALVSMRKGKTMHSQQLSNSIL